MRLHRLTIPLVLITGVFVHGCGPSYSAFVRASTAGTLHVGMTKEEVRVLVGDPDTTAVRELARDDLREVWGYCRRVSFIARTCIPIRAFQYEGDDYIIFRGNKVIGWNLPDPFSHDWRAEEPAR